MAASIEAKILELDARCYDEAKHRALLSEIVREQRTTWFCCEFAPGDPDMLVAGSSEGEIRVYSVKGLSRASSSQKEQQQQQQQSPRPLLTIQAHQGPCYSLTFASCGSSRLLLLSCGDDGAVRGWDWAEVKAAATGSSAKASVKATFEASLPAGGDAGTLPPELNSVSVGDRDNHVYAGAGDGSAYCWDLETGAEVAAVKGAGGGVLCTDLRGTALAMGCTGGTVQVWDTRSLDRPSGSFAAGSGASSGPPGGACWPVRCLRFDSGGNWLFAGAGSRLHPWSLAAGALGKGVVDTGASLPHALLVEPNRVLVAGDEPVLRRYDFSGRLVSRAATDAVCTFGLARCDETRVLAMAGCSGRLDVLADNGSKIGGLF